MSHYVPPHRRRDKGDGDISNSSSQAFQQKAWQALSRSITAIINRVNNDNVGDSATELFRENIVRGRGLLARSLMRTQQVDADLTSVLSALVARINKELPTVVFLLCKRLAVHWTRAYRRKDWAYLENTSRFLSWLYIFEVINVNAIYQIILTHLMAEVRGEEDVDQAAKVFRATFRAMSQRARREFHDEVLTPFRDLLAMDDDSLRLSARSQAVLEGCLKDVQKWERLKDEEALIPEHLVLFDLEEQTTHSIDVEERYDTEDALGRYVYDPDYDAHEEAYEEARRAILGDNWELELLEGVAAAEEEDEEEDEEGEAKGHGAGPVSSSSAPVTTADQSKPIIDEAERNVRKEVYMAIRSSVRADEAVHKILREMKPQTERSICFMVIEGCCEERTYKRMYGMIAERLCKSNARFQAFFVESFRSRYLDCADLSVKQIEYTCRILGHLLRTDSLYWSRCLGVLDIVHNNESQRLFIHNLFSALTEEIGMPALVKRFQQDRELRDSTTKLFPVSADTASLELAINMYVAMDLEALSEPLRVELERRRLRDGGGGGLVRLGQKRDREEPIDDREYI